ncbi:hypothetical protein CS006_07355 [Bifidobacterium primatium]|uniref:DNA primase/polymerase bifunctional N-terminal domain-containing protein n=1 Tax=Bifidobacterium primatium TaxID=2045438 RepID=A0A2M9H8B5_9BIFI|nr:bifunctional DNA primase/polymerase [Bifidobacterium primatium]PJM73055.1 hypothetical protein CS006_07355 [Bifidobacterium primatium]
MAWYEDKSQFRFSAVSTLTGLHDYRVIPLANGDRICPTRQYGGALWKNERNDPGRHPELLQRMLFGLYMGSTDLICLDIDRHENKGDGFLTLKKWESLGASLPMTLATNSRHGSGVHVFYRGSGRLNALNRDIQNLNLGDKNLTGLDVIIRGLVTFCTQDRPPLMETRANGEPLAVCPEWLEWLIHKRLTPPAMPVSVPVQRHRKGCPAKCVEPIEKGIRNTELYRWGFGISHSYDNWDEHVRHRGLASGLPRGEIENIIKSIRRGRTGA